MTVYVTIIVYLKIILSFSIGLDFSIGVDVLATPGDGQGRQGHPTVTY